MALTMHSDRISQALCGIELLRDRGYLVTTRENHFSNSNPMGLLECVVSHGHSSREPARISLDEACMPHDKLLQLVRERLGLVDARPALAPHQQRMLDEAKELGERVEKLEAWLGTDAFKALDVDEKVDLREQYLYMIQYQRVLRRRIGRWEDCARKVAQEAGVL